MPKIEITGSAFGKGGIGLNRVRLGRSPAHPDVGFRLSSLPGKIWRGLPIAQMQYNSTMTDFDRLVRRLHSRAKTQGSASVQDSEISKAVGLRARAVRLKSGKVWSQADRALEFDSLKKSLKAIARATDDRMARTASQSADRVIEGLGGLL